MAKKRACNLAPVRLLVLLLVCAAVLVVSSCKSRKAQPAATSSLSNPDVYDLEDIQEVGELICVTLSGPESYYQYHGVDMGVEYLMAERFATSHGLRIRMEIARDTTELFKILKENKADLIAFELPQKLIKKKGFLACGAYTDSLHVSWAVRSSSPELAKELDRWYKPSMRLAEVRQMNYRISHPLVYHRAYSPLLNGKKGQISKFDGLFVRYGQTIGWDWRLLAAQCWQESGFDPQAVSWAGARGLMQIMPRTAESLGVSAGSLFNPETSVSTATRYLKQISSHFRDVPNPIERIKFTLAAYNGGMHHIRDAMNLARKYRRNPHSWEAVSYFVFHLSEPRFYRDPVVNYGYMIGSETYNYVNQVVGRWYDYCGKVHGTPSPMVSMDAEPVHTHKRNRFSKSNQIISRDDSIFQMP